MLPLLQRRLTAITKVTMTLEKIPGPVGGGARMPWRTPYAISVLTLVRRLVSLNCFCDDIGLERFFFCTTICDSFRGVDSNP